MEAVAPDPRHEVIVQCRAGARSQFVENRLHCCQDIFSCGLTCFNIDVEAAIGAFGATVQQALQRKEGRGLARSPWRVQDKVLLGVDEAWDVIQVHAFQGRDAVVFVWNDRAFGVEGTHVSSTTVSHPGWKSWSVCA